MGILEERLMRDYTEKHDLEHPKGTWELHPKCSTCLTYLAFGAMESFAARPALFLDKGVLT